MQGPSGCTGLPTFTVENMAYWEMGPLTRNFTRDSMYVTGHCSAGFIGTVRSYCQGGIFQTPVGSCAHEQRCERSFFVSRDPNEFWSCPGYGESPFRENIAEGEMCTATCSTGLVG
jgi:hypothetical protein